MTQESVEYQRAREDEIETHKSDLAIRMDALDAKIVEFCKLAGVTSIPKPERKKKRFRDIKKGIVKAPVVVPVPFDEDTLEIVEALVKEIDIEIDKFNAIANAQGKLVKKRWIAIKKAGGFGDKVSV